MKMGTEYKVGGRAFGITQPPTKFVYYKQKIIHFFKRLFKK